MEQQVKENTNKLQNLELKNNTLENTMTFIKEELHDVKKILCEIKDEIKGKDKEYNDKFATKEELENAKKLEEKGKLINNPFIWLIIILITTAIMQFIFKRIGL